MEKIYSKQKLSIKAQAFYSLCAVAAAVALPQLFHVMGLLAGTGSALGEQLLPMHLPIILVGLMAGQYAGAAAGFLAPMLSFLLTGMPSAALLPFMMIELLCYGLCAGLLRNVKMPVILKVLITQTAGRAVRACAILIAVLAFGSTSMPISIIWTSVLTGVFGLALQWTMIPLIMYRVERKND